MPARRPLLLFGSLAIVAAALLVYAGSLSAPFLFDDVLSIVESPNVTRPESWLEALTGPPGSGASGRPFVALSLAANHALFGLDPFGYRLTNALLLGLAGAFLFALARRALAHAGGAVPAGPPAFVLALLWTVHPLHTDAQLQVVYRGETLVALFGFIALLAVDRLAAGEGGRGARVAAVLATAAAMASKEVAVSLPLLALAWDRTFRAGSFRAAWRFRRGLYLALAATWIVLLAAVLSGDRGASVGFAQQRVTPLEYLRAQPEAILTYLRLAVWPHPLCFDYSGRPMPSGWGEALLPTVCVLALVAGARLAFARRRAAGFLGLAFFALLAPSSSVIPISAEWIGEHRMVAPLACVLALAVPGGYAGLARSLGRRAAPVGTLVAALLVFSAGAATHVRGRDYRSAEALWRSVLAVLPESARAHHELAQALAAAGRPSEALPHAERALRRDPDLKGVEASLGSILLQLGRASEAVDHLVAGRRELPDNAVVAGNLGAALGLAGRPAEAERALREALRLDPSYRRARANLAAVLLELGRRDEALREARAVLAEDPADRTARAVLARAGR